MWTKQRILSDLEEMRILPGDAVLIHASMRAVGPVEGGADTVIEALREIVGPEGTLMAATFISANRLPAPHEIADPLPFADPYETEADVKETGILADHIRLHPEAYRSDHPTLSFAAIGANAEFITRDAPFDFPLGAGGPLARLHQLNGKALLVGVEHEVNSSIHLAENWANAPHSHRRARIRTGETTWRDMEGSPECSAGFPKIEPILRQARIIKTGHVGSAPSQSMRVQFLVSMAREMLVAQPDCLLCDDPNCPSCAHARKMTRAQDNVGMDR